MADVATLAQGMVVYPQPFTAGARVRFRSLAHMYPNGQIRIIHFDPIHNDRRG